MECDYYAEDQVLTTFNIRQGLSIVHFNCRSPFSNFEEVRTYLNRKKNELRFAFDIIALSYG